MRSATTKFYVHHLVKHRPLNYLRAFVVWRNFDHRNVGYDFIKISLSALNASYPKKVGLAQVALSKVVTPGNSPSDKSRLRQTIRKKAAVKTTVKLL